MSTDDFIISLFCRVDTVMTATPKHRQANLYPSEIVTLALLFALKGVGPCAFDRWLRRNYADWFPTLPDRTRLFRLFDAHYDWAEYFLAEPTLLGVADSYGIELRHPWREDRADRQIGSKGLSNHRWIVGAKFVYVLNQHGLIVAWDYAAANVPDTAFQRLIRDFQDEMVIFTDMGFHAKAGDPPNMRACKRGTWNGRMVIETVLSMLTTVCRLKKLSHRTWAAVRSRLAFTMALFNLLVQWNGLPVDRDGNIRLSMAAFSL
jgi:hypothetical protein